MGSLAGLSIENFEPSIPIRDWAALMTATWTEEVMAEMKHERRRACIARCREKAKFKLQWMRKERERLEKQFKQYLAALNGGASRANNGKSTTHKELCHLAVESDALRTEAINLLKKLQQYDRFYSLVQEATQNPNYFSIEPSSTSLTVREASKISKWVLSPQCDESSWSVSFSSGEPSFNFHPFTRVKFDSILKRCNDTLALDAPSIKTAETLMGWTVHRAPLTHRPDGSIVFHARFTMRVTCSLDDLDAIIATSSLDSWSWVWTPPNWGYNERKQACCQVLQDFETDAYVLAHNIPGRVHTCYISLAQRLPRTRLPCGKQSITYVMVIANSEADVQSQENIEWVNEGGRYITCTEVDTNTIDVCYDHWASCHDELHANHLFVRWATFARCWSQKMAPSNLLRPAC